MELYLVRHTHTSAPSGICYGRADVSVAETFPVEAAGVVAALEGSGATVGDASFAPGQRDRDVQLYALPRYETSTWFVL